MKNNVVYAQLIFECDVDELFNDFVNKLNDFIRSYDGRLEEFLSSRITAAKGLVIDDPWTSWDRKNVK